MGGWTEHKGQAVLLPLDNVDTDQLIPARFMSTPRSAGYGNYLLHDLRHDEDGTPKPDFPLNANPVASILVAGPNFGSGSSREAAVYALVDAGIRAVIAPSFGDIFASNAVNNGLLPARVSPEAVEKLREALADQPSQASVDLETRCITINDITVDFELQDNWRTKLVNGWDDIDLTLQHADVIRAFRDERHLNANWAWPAAPN
ncbi:3-isopropylmalate dehydratase small subunit [Marimonas sp. MJW-29]|uniref:3-isopropylmalate dehydratase n=1 Tax=Sulfitobacter sediminis TaxID=3234186 RepID=A0ABV3RRC5_9RHOB